MTGSPRSVRSSRHCTLRRINRHQQREKNSQLLGSHQTPPLQPASSPLRYRKDDPLRQQSRRPSARSAHFPLLKAFTTDFTKKGEEPFIESGQYFSCLWYNRSIVHRKMDLF